MKQIGIVGLGLFAQDVHLPSLRILERLRGDFQITALADLRPERLATGGDLWPEARLYSSADELRQSEHLDGVFLFTSPGATAAVGTEFLESGVPCLLEKPPGLTFAENRQLAAAAQRGGTSAFVAFNRRYAPITRVACRLMKEFSGPVEQVRCDFRRIGRTGEDFSTTAIHGIDTVSFLAGAPIKELEIERESIPGGENLRLRARHVNGVRSTLEFLPDSDRQRELYTVITQNELLELHFPCGTGSGMVRILQNSSRREFLLPAAPLKEKNFFYGGYYAEDNRFLTALSAPQLQQNSFEAFETTATSVAAAEAIRNGLSRQNFSGSSG